MSQKKNCMVFETLGKVSDLHISEGVNNEVRLSGVFGVCGIKNQNNRIYDRENYKAMVESLQQIIANEGCPGELEHPNSMNINLENVSHKIESIEIDENGTVTGTILLLNTPKGQIAKAIVEGGLPLFISSRGSGTITNEGKVTLSTIKTYDLVGTPGFAQAKLTLKENQTLECLNESLDENGNSTWVIIDESEDKKEEKEETTTKITGKLIAKKKDNKWGFEDKESNVVVEYKYDKVTEFNKHGYAGVKLNGKWGSIDDEGNVVIEPIYALENNTIIDFVGKWHIAEDINANYYTDTKE